MSIKNNQIEEKPKVLPASGSTPVTGPGKGAFFSKIVSGMTEGFYVDSSGNEIQITSNGQVNAPVFGEANTASNVGAGSGLVFKQKSGIDLQFRKIKAGSNITVAVIGDDIEISSATGAGESNTASNVGTGNQIFKQKSGVDLQFRTLKAGSNVTISSSLNEITISASGGGGGSLLVQDEGSLIDNAVTTLNFVGAGVTATQISPGVVQLSIAAGSGETNTASNLGAGTGIFSSKSGVDLRFKSLVAGTNMSISSTSTEITLNATGGSGEVNTASNVGTGGVGIFKQKSGADLQFKKINSATGITISDDTGNSEIDIALDINALTEETVVSGSTDFVLLWDTSASAHRKVKPANLPSSGGGETNTASNVGTGGVGVFKQKTGVNLEFKKINGGSGISVTDDTGNSEVDVAVDINGLTTDASPDGAADYVMTYDASAGTNKKVLLDNLPGGGGSGLASEFTFTLSAGATIASRTVTGLPSGWKIGDGAGSAVSGSPAMDAVSSQLSQTAADLILQHGLTKNMIEFVAVSIDPTGAPFGLDNNIVSFITGGNNQTYRTNAAKSQSHIKDFQTDVGNYQVQIYVRFL